MTDRRIQLDYDFRDGDEIIPIKGESAWAVVRKDKGWLVRIMYALPGESHILAFMYCDERMAFEKGLFAKPEGAHRFFEVVGKDEWKKWKQSNRPLLDEVARRIKERHARKDAELAKKAASAKFDEGEWEEGVAI